MFTERNNCNQNDKYLLGRVRLCINITTAWHAVKYLQIGHGHDHVYGDTR